MYHKYLIIGLRQTPRAVKGTTKYGNTGSCTTITFQRFSISDERKQILAGIANQGLARSTWSTYRTAERLLLLCQKQEQHRMELPLTEDDVIVFIGWLMVVRKLKATTINGYLSGIRQLHISKGIDPQELGTKLVNKLVKGKGNVDNIVARRDATAKRLPMTMTMMRILKAKTIAWDAQMGNKLLMWAISALAFHGAFRIHELLAREEMEFDPDFTLLAEDVKLKQEGGNSSDRFLEVKLKCPKENKTGRSTIVEVYETHGTLCPVKAFTRWKDNAQTQIGLPLFRTNTGASVTGKAMNSWLRGRLEDIIDYKMGKFSSHSFRIGLATTLATKGFSDDDIREAGRWNSNTHEIYMRLPRNKRNGVAKKIGKL